VCVLGAVLAAVVVALWVLERMRRRAAGEGRAGRATAADVPAPSLTSTP